MLNTFLHAESGAVTVDWVVLTAGLVGLSLAVMGVLSTGVQTAAMSIAAELSDDIIGTLFERTAAGLRFLER